MDVIMHETKNAMWRRDEQLRRWEISDTNLESDIPRKDRKPSLVRFNESCVFLAACISSDTDEISRLLARGVNINTSNIDGLTALHQACIDDNMAMVKFLVENGADVDAADNEGWTSLHAAASCGFLKITRYLISHGARIDAVNNDGELPLDLAEGSEVERLLSETMKNLGINADTSRGCEEEVMFRDASTWLNSGRIADLPHPKSGATALHIAATKGYIKVLKVLLDCGFDTELKDFDGWTATHAAAHWGQIEACRLLFKHHANLNALNNWGQTALDICDPDIETELEELISQQNEINRKIVGAAVQPLIDSNQVHSEENGSNNSSGDKMSYMTPSHLPNNKDQPKKLVDEPQRTSESSSLASNRNTTPPSESLLDAKKKKVPTATLR